MMRFHALNPELCFAGMFGFFDNWRIGNMSLFLPSLVSLTRHTATHDCFSTSTGTPKTTSRGRGMGYEEGDCIYGTPAQEKSFF